jgi:hypothetical protein
MYTVVLAHRTAYDPGNLAVSENGFQGGHQFDLDCHAFLVSLYDDQANTLDLLAIG